MLGVKSELVSGIHKNMKVKKSLRIYSKSANIQSNLARENLICSVICCKSFTGGSKSILPIQAKRKQLHHHPSSIYPIHFPFKLQFHFTLLEIVFSFCRPKVYFPFVIHADNAERNLNTICAYLLKVSLFSTRSQCI